MKAGRLRHRIEVQRKTETRDSRGGVVETWQTQQKRWADIQPLRMRQRFEAAQLDSRLSHFIVLRYYPTLSPEHRIVYQGRVFNIESVIHPRERSIMTEARCMEQV